MDRKQTKERIIDTAIECFVKYGIKAVKMDDIASMLLISKRTIYELFNTKENLVRETLLTTRERQNSNMASIMEKADGDVLALMIEVFKTETEYMAKINPLFFVDLAEYPQLIDLSREDQFERRNKIRVLFEKGVQEHVFRKGVNYDLFLDAFSIQASAIFKQELYLKYSLLDIFQTYTLSVFRGLLTETAVKRFDQQFLAMKGA